MLGTRLSRSMEATVAGGEWDREREGSVEEAVEGAD